MRLIIPVAIALCFGLAFEAQAKDRKRETHWKDVVQLDTPPPKAQCEYLELLDVGSSSMFVFTAKQMRNRVNKRTQKKVAKIGGNAFYVVDKTKTADGTAYEAKAYYCKKMPEIDQPKNKG